MCKPAARARRSVVRTCVAALIAAAGCSAIAVAAADQIKYPIFTPANFVDTMKIVDVNFSAVTAAVAAGDFPTAKAQLVRSRERLALTITFWRDRHKDDAIATLRAALTSMDDLDTVLSASPVDTAAATAGIRQIATKCQSCHATYREQDASTHAYRFKAGLVEQP